MGVNYIAPPTWMLVTLENGEIALDAGQKAKAAIQDHHLDDWSSGLLVRGGCVHRNYHRRDVRIHRRACARRGLEGIFSDWPATVTYYANCMGLE